MTHEAAEERVNGSEPSSDSRPADARTLTGLRWYGAIILGVLVADRVAKLAADAWLTLGEPVDVIGSFLRLTLVHNPDASFGLKFGGPALHIAITIVGISLIAFLLWRTPPTDRLSRVGFALILGGAGGNLWDRIATARVTDFIDVGFGNVRWWAFNVADSAISVGVAMLLLAYFLEIRRRPPVEPSPPAPTP